MNTGLPESPEDRLLDELLREQAHGPDEAFLQRIEAAVDARSLPVVVPRPGSGSNRWLAVAAAIALVTGVGLWWKSADQPADAPAMTGTEPPPMDPTFVNPGNVKPVAGTPRRNRLTPPNPITAPDAAKRGMPDNMTANHNLPEPNPFLELAQMFSLSESNPSGGTLAGTRNGLLLGKLSGQAANDRIEFADLVKNPTGDETHVLLAPVEIIPKGVPRNANIKGHYGNGKPTKKKDSPANMNPKTAAPK